MDSALYWGTLYIYRLNNNNAFIERERLLAEGRPND